MVTNFHQPGTSLLMLLHALLPAERIRNAYQHALAGSYRFLSYGDAMLIRPV
jgi:S-adenosylmethionine:tRNA ribosyltransferase-isomerase